MLPTRVADTRTVYVMVAVHFYEDRAATVKETREYVREAVSAWGNRLGKESPFFGDNKRVSVKYAGVFDPNNTNKVVYK